MHKIFGKILNEFYFPIKYLGIVQMCMYHVVLGCIANPLIRLVLIYPVLW